MRLLAIAFIWVGCAVAWVILGTTLVHRTSEVGDALDSQVHALWGPPGRQYPPKAVYQVTEITKETVTTNSAAASPIQQVVERERQIDRPLLLDGSEISVDFTLVHRQKGLLWFPTYGVKFEGEYTFKNPSEEQQAVRLSFPLGSQNTSFDDFHVVDAQGHAVAYRVVGGTATWESPFEPRERKRFRVGYRTRGTSSWQYMMADDASEVRNFELGMTTSFPDVDFPVGTTSPTRHAAHGNRWEGQWRFKSLIAGSPIGIAMPQLLNPGPLASRVTFFAPLSLLFFFFVVAILATVQKREMHPMHYLLLGCAFFAFHLLFAYLVDRVAVIPSFVIASVVSLFLVVTYARLFVGWRFALREMGLSQLIYLVLFSLTFFWEGFTGLSVTIGAIITLFVVMQITGRVDWSSLGTRRRNRTIPAGLAAEPGT